MDRKISILGQEYRVVDDESILRDNLDGLAAVYDKVIMLRPTEELLDPMTDTNTKKAYRREVMRHEIIHSFFRESGHERWQNDEDLVSWIAIMYPKMNEVFGELGCSS